jgi:hypothetical protein
LGYLKEGSKKKADKKFTDQEVYLVQKEIDNRKLAQSKIDEEAKTKVFNDRLDRNEATQTANRNEDIARVTAQFTDTQNQQQAQFERSLAAQQAALQAQLDAQEALQRRAEEAALRAQVPQMTAGSMDARRIRSKSTNRQRARQASMGTNQLRVPLSIGGSMGGMSGGGSPVKLNIGS